MSDLYRGLIRRELRKGQRGEEFWGKYNALDSTVIPTESLLKLQVEGLKALEQTKDYSEVNKFLQQAQSNMAQEDAQLETLVANEVYSRIIELINSGLTGSTINPYQVVKKRGGNAYRGDSEVQGEISKIIAELSQLLSQVNTNEGTAQKIVDSVQHRLESFKWGPTPQSYIKEKADLIEMLMVDKMNQNPGFRAVVTGSWTNQGMQLIEDMFAFMKGQEYTVFSGDLAKMKFTVKIDGRTEERTASSAGNLLDQLDALNGTNASVSLSDELYDALQKASAIAGQAKSGLAGQAILNKNKRNAISLAEINFDPKLLWDLYQADMQDKTQYFKDYGKQNSTDLSTLANYALSKNIAKTAISRNQLYLTAEGFVTASQWMEHNGQYLVFTPAVRQVGSDFMSAVRPYFFTK